MSKINIVNMWVVKLKIRHDDWILEKTSKYDISASGIPLNSFKRNGKQYHTGMVFLQGEDKNKNRFINSLKKDKRIKQYSVKGNQIFVLVESEDHIAPLFDNSMFFIKPVFFRKGFEYWEICSWERESLMKFYKKIKKIADVEILKLKEEEPSVFVQHAAPKLSDKQRRALEIALEHGYYNYPRKITVDLLSKKLNVPRTTFQEHLRKAESKIMGIFIQSAKK